MGVSLFHSLIILLAFSLFSPVFAAKKPYIVYLGSHSHGHDPSEVQLFRATNNHYELLGSHLGSVEKAQDAIFYSYNKHINGFAAMLEKEEADAISKDSGVVSVFLSKQLKLHTTHSWQFLGLEKNGKIHPSSLWKKARFGEDIIIGNLDSGVWPESQSFNDHGLGPIPSKWKGSCTTKGGVSCNRKLIGAQVFNGGFKVDAAFNNITLNSTTLDSPRDQEGHGTHTLSTAGGSFVPKANIFGFGEGTAKGGSPKARVAAYRVCFPNGGCTGSDILAAFDQAIHDGVDVLSLSIGGDPVDYFEDATAIGAFHAVQKGITVVCSAGNDGPTPSSVTNVAPWILTVGASTLDRKFESLAVLGNNVTYKGESLSPQYLDGKKLYPLVSGADAHVSNATSSNSSLCLEGTLDPKKVEGKILLCVRGVSSRVDKSLQAKNAGAVGLILANDALTGDETIADAHFLPATHISYKDGLSVLEYINSTKSPFAYVTHTQTLLNEKPAPLMASFSSQGPNVLNPEILKPDITAPGVSILAAYTQDEGPSDADSDQRRVFFNVESGTSMSCPHISGVVGLLKSLHPDWSPAAIRSAIMTTATTRDNLNGHMLNGSHIKATPFNYGGGHVWPNRAADPGLVYDITPNDYLNFLCGIGYDRIQIGNFTKHECPKSFNILDLNYPSITVPNLVGSITVSRTVRNVDPHATTYHVAVHEPQGISVDVEPKILELKKIGEEKTYKVTLKAHNKQAADNEYVFGSLAWSDGKHHVRSPLVVMKGS
ncbi:hypothetical protein ACHQM5_024804 [Ranunculus cassubicifolius]